MDQLPLDKAYSSDYDSARQRFRVGAAAAGAKLSAHPVSATGFDTGALTIDVAELGGEPNGPVVVLSSGLHGVEGFFGSAIQLETLARFRRGGLELGSTRILLVHALNPYGFATLRRTSQENVDLNRNFLATDQSYSKPGSTAHTRAKQALIECFCPAKRAWRQQVLEQGRVLVDRAVKAAGGG